jgi:hypothetical protein
MGKFFEFVILYIALQVTYENSSPLLKIFIQKCWPVCVGLYPIHIIQREKLSGEVPRMNACEDFRIWMCAVLGGVLGCFVFVAAYLQWII